MKCIAHIVEVNKLKKKKQFKSYFLGKFWRRHNPKED